MIKINFEELIKIEEYKNYEKMLETSNGENSGFDKNHSHTIDGKDSGPSTTSNFFKHCHISVDGRIVGPPIEYDPVTLEHIHERQIYNRNGSNEE